jgi:hypothetical protein
MDIEQFPDRQVADEAPQRELNESGEDEKSESHGMRFAMSPRLTPVFRSIFAPL